MCTDGTPGAVRWPTTHGHVRYAAAASPYKTERQSALAPPARFPCDQRRGGTAGAGPAYLLPGREDVAPSRVQKANAHHIKPHQTEPKHYD